MIETEEVLSRNKKREMKKKERKRKQRQNNAILKLERIKDKEDVIASDSDECRDGQSQTELLSFTTINSICEECMVAKTKYYCEDCIRSYCESCYETFHKELQVNSRVFHMNVRDLTGSSFLNAITQEKKSTKKSGNKQDTISIIEESGFVGEGIPIIESSERINSKEVKQHNGLRCKKCFCQLVRDDEFLFAGGRLFVNPQILAKRHWQGLHQQGGVVFCENMHNVGRVIRATNANQGIKFYRLATEKTTWEDNYVKNPQFEGSFITMQKQIGTTRPLMPCEQFSTSY